MKRNYIIRKFVSAESAIEAIKMDTKTPVHDCYVDEETKNKNEMKSCIGFVVEADEEEE